MFEAYSTGQSTGTRTSTVDFDALNKYVVETADLQERTVLTGVVSGIIDLGAQEQEDAAMKWEGSEEDEAAEIEKNPATYFEDMRDPVTKKMQRMKRWPVKPTQCIAISVDFPDIMLEKGQFFGDDDAEAKPLRMYLGGQFYLVNDKVQVIGRPTPLREKKNSKDQWSFDKKHLCYKMAAAAKLVDASKDEVFKPKDIDQLLGQAFQFEAQIYFNEKGYYTEDVKFIGALGRGQKAPEGEVSQMLIQFNQPNKEKDLKELRSHVKNTIKRASNYEGSKIQAQLEKIEAAYKSNKSSDEGADEPEQEEKKPEKKVTSKPKTTPKVPRTLDEDLDEDACPF